MCGIVGYIGANDASPVLLAGLRRLEYRGYDSAGLATLDGGGLILRKRAGRVKVLEDAVAREPAPGSCGISHTRWATHGPATDANAHPHVGGEGVVAVVHNGVIENHAGLRRELEAEGFAFRSQTDTEVVAHLIARELGTGADLFGATQRALARLEGTYGLAVVSPRCPGTLVGARLGSPLVVGVGDGEHLLASDASAIAAHTASVSYLQDGEVVRLTPDDFQIIHRDRGSITPRIDRLDFHARRGRTRRPRPLHAQGDPRAAGGGPRRLPGPAPPRRGDRAVRRPEHHDPPAPPGPPGRPGRLRHELARRPGRRIPDRAAGPPAGRGRIRQRIPLPERPAGRPDPHLRPEPVGRDDRHPGRAPRGQTPRSSEPGHLQRRGQHHRPRGRRRHLPPCRPRDRRRQHQGLLRAGDGPDDAGPPPRPDPPHLLFRGAGRRSTRSRPSPPPSRAPWRPSRPSSRPPSDWRRPAAPCTSAATSIIPSPWKGR